MKTNLFILYNLGMDNFKTLLKCVAKGDSVVLLNNNGVYITFSRQLAMNKEYMTIKVEDALKHSIFNTVKLNCEQQKEWDTIYKHAFSLEKTMWPRFLVNGHAINSRNEHLYKPNSELGSKVIVKFRKHLYNTESTYNFQYVEEYNNVHDIHYMYVPPSSKTGRKLLTLDSRFFVHGQRSLFLDEIESIRVMPATIEESEFMLIPFSNENQEKYQAMGSN